MRRIVLATDLSAPARQAAERAAQLSHSLAVPMELLHIVNLELMPRLQNAVPAAVAASLPQRVLKAAQETLETWAADLQSRYAITPTARVIDGELLHELLDAVGDEDAESNLLVCGATGESIVRHFFLGSTAERLSGRTSCPMLVVKNPVTGPYRHVLVPVDFSPSSLAAIQHVQALAPQAGLTLLHAVELPFQGLLSLAGIGREDIDGYRATVEQEANEKLHALCQQAGLPPSTLLRVVQGEPVASILAQEQGCDLIVMGKHGESRFQKLFIGKNTKKVLAESRHDVLVSV